MNEKALRELTPRDVNKFNDLLGRDMGSLELGELQMLIARKDYLTKENLKRVEEELEIRKPKEKTKKK